jgi:hypothetical protein
MVGSRRPPVGRSVEIVCNRECSPPAAPRRRTRVSASRAPSPRSSLHVAPRPAGRALRTVPRQYQSGDDDAGSGSHGGTGCRPTGRHRRTARRTDVQRRRLGPTLSHGRPAQRNVAAALPASRPARTAAPATASTPAGKHAPDHDIDSGAPLPTEVDPTFVTGHSGKGRSADAQARVRPPPAMGVLPSPARAHKVTALSVPLAIVEYEQSM